MCVRPGMTNPERKAWFGTKPCPWVRFGSEIYATTFAFPVPVAGRLRTAGATGLFGRSWTMHDVPALLPDIGVGLFGFL